MYTACIAGAGMGILLSHWKEDMEPVEINIEIYGLG